MNDRILELAKQAGMSECSLGYGMPENVLWSERSIEKFAELLIRECAGVELYWLNEQDRKSVAENIKTHFGIKVS